DHGEYRPPADLRIDMQFAVVAAYDLVNDRQAEAGAVADFLRREERIANLLDDVRRDAAAGVRDADRHVFVALAFGRDHDLSTTLDRLRSIRQQVQKHLVDLR